MLSLFFKKSFVLFNSVSKFKSESDIYSPSILTIFDSKYI